METEKCHECTNMGKEKRLKLWWRLYCTSLPQQDIQNIRQTDFCSTECTSTAFYVSSTLMIMIYSIISLLNISFVSISCMIKKLSVWTRDAKWKWHYLEMLCTVKPGMLYAKSHKNVTLYCWFKLILSEYNYLHFTAGLTYWMWTARRSVDIISMTIAHKKNNSYLPMHYALFVKMFHS